MRDERRDLNAPIVTRTKKRRVRSRRTVVRFWLLTVPLIVSLFGVGCLNNGPYVTFRQLGFGFEHPRGWAKNVERYPDFVQTVVWDPTVSENESAVKVFVNRRLGLGGNAEQEARDNLARRLSSDSGERNFALIRNDSITLDGRTGYLAEYTLEAVASYKVDPAKRSYVPTRVVDISVGWAGSVYEIEVSASQNEWSAHESDIQHVLDTFRWR